MEKYIHVKKANLVSLEEKRFNLTQLLLKHDGGRYLPYYSQSKVEIPSGAGVTGVVYNAKGEYIIPGFVDLQCVIGDFQSRDFSSKWSELLCAAEGGYTTVCPVPVGERFFDKKENVLTYLREINTSNGVRIVPCLPIPKKKSGDGDLGIAALADMGIRVLSDGAGKYVSSENMREIMRECQQNDVLLICSAHDGSLMQDGCVNLGRMSRYFKVEGISESAELCSISRNLILAGETGCRIHVTGISLGTSVEMIRTAKKLGVKVTASTAPQYFCCDENELLYRGAKAKLYPPLRKASDVEAVASGIEDGTIDCISTDHVSISPGYKKDIKTAKFGSSGFETAFSASYTHLVASGRISIFRLIEAMSIIPLQVVYGSDYEKHIGGYIAVDIEQKKFHTKNSVKAVHWSSVFDNRDLRGVVTRNFNLM